MIDDAADLVALTFAGDVIHWRGPSPFFFIALPERHFGAIRDAARSASYGWGMVPVDATIGAHAFTTSLFPKDGTYLLPLRDAVRKATGIALGDTVAVAIKVRASAG